MSIEYERLKNTFLKLDTSTLNHCTRVYKIAKAYEAHKMSDSLLSHAALLHDIGKIYISQNILNKPFALTTLEREVINLHSYIGYQLIKDLDLEESLADIIYMHHGMNAENVLNKENSLLLINNAKKLHTIDAFDAMISDRPYRSSMPLDVALSISMDDIFADSDVIDFLSHCDIGAIFNIPFDIEEVLYQIAEERGNDTDTESSKVLVPVLSKKIR